MPELNLAIYFLHSFKDETLDYLCFALVLSFVSSPANVTQGQEPMQTGGRTAGDYTLHHLGRQGLHS